MKNFIHDEFNGWCFLWESDCDGGPGYFCAHLFNKERSVVWDSILKSWHRRGESRKSAIQRIRRYGGRVVKVKFKVVGR